MLDEVLAATPPYPPHLHRHVLQNWLVRHRRPPAGAADERRAVYEYVARTAKDKTGQIRIHASEALVAWLRADDDVVRGWRPVPRLAALVHQFNGDLRKQFDLGRERDWKAFACTVALSLQSALRWPEALVSDALREVLWEPAPGVPGRTKLGATRALQFVRRHSESGRGLDLGRPAEFGQMLVSVLAEIEQGQLPEYVLSPAQWAWLEQPVPGLPGRVPLTGLAYLLVVERGLVRERDLAKPDVAATVARELPGVLARLRMPARLRAAHRALIAPVVPIARREGEAPPASVVTVVGPLSHGSGLGAAARACVEAFKAAEIPVEVLNLKAGWGRDDEDSGAGVTPRVRGDINVIHFNPDVLVENLSRFGFEQFEGRYNIGYFVWETTQASLAHRLGADLVDEIWVPTEYCREIYERITDKPVVVVRTPVPPIHDVSWATRRWFELPEGRFTFVYTFDGASRFTRKNPLAAVRAFQRAFPGDDGVQLVLKTQNTTHLTPADERLHAELRKAARADRRLVVIDSSFGSNEVHGLIAVCDAYVALHRSEGFGYGMAEAMKLRVPVIATAHSGNADFTTEETAWPVRARLVPVGREEFVYDEAGQLWAEPDEEHAAERMREVREGRGREAKVERAFELIQRRYDERSVGRTYRARIEAIRAGDTAGARVANLEVGR